LDKGGIPTLKQILAVDRPFPVAGLAYWVDDWHAYRCCPTPHLHQGLDLMAERGTPLVSVANGVISRKVNDPKWAGLAIALTDRSGTRFSYAHLSAFAPGIQVGQHVRMGDVIGYVGTTGDAAGGPPHLHFEVHPYGGVAVPPKPLVDKWLAAAEKRALELVQRKTGKRLTAKDLDLSLWMNKLLALESAQHELQASNVLPARPAVGTAPKASPGVSRQPLPDVIPILLSLLALAALLMHRVAMLPVTLGRRRGQPAPVGPDEPEPPPLERTEEPIAIEDRPEDPPEDRVRLVKLWLSTPAPLLLREPDPELFDLLLRRLGRRAGHELDTGLGLGEGDDVPDGVPAGQEHHDTVDA
jgi:hypothetical protein